MLTMVPALEASAPALPAIVVPVLMPGTPPPASPEGRAQQEEDAEDEQREEQEAEREEPAPVLYSNHLCGPSGLGQAMVHAGVVGRHPDGHPGQDREDRDSDHPCPSHLSLLSDGSRSPAYIVPARCEGIVNAAGRILGGTG